MLTAKQRQRRREAQDIDRLTGPIREAAALSWLTRWTASYRQNLTAALDDFHGVSQATQDRRP